MIMVVMNVVMMVVVMVVVMILILYYDDGDFGVGMMIVI